MAGLHDYLQMKKNELREVKALLQAENDRRQGLVTRRDNLQQEITDLEDYIAAKEQTP